MPVSKDMVLHTSQLARLDIRHGADGQAADEKLDAFASKLEVIVGYIDILKSADTTGVEPLFSPMRLTAPPRADTPVMPYTREEALQNAPEQSGGFFVVPKVL